VADESGEPGNPIRLTSDPSWGEGDACIYGSMLIEGGWTRADAESAPDMPEPELVWYKDIGTQFTPRAVWMQEDGAITRIPLARDPNWEVTNPDDVKSQWYEWQETDRVTVDIGGEEHLRVWAGDPEHLTDEDEAAYVGGTVWTEYTGVMGSPFPNRIEKYDPERHAIRFSGPFGDPTSHRHPVPHCRYFLENLPRFLDAPGEYYYAEKGPLAGRLYLRLPGDRDPNGTAVEIARRFTLLDIRNQSHIHVSGLTFRFQNVTTWYDRHDYGIPESDPACVKALGVCRDIRVANCKFEHVVRAFMVASGGEDASDELAFTDNDVQHCDYGPIMVRSEDSDPPAGSIYRLDILRNRLYKVGVRPMRQCHGHAVWVRTALLLEVAGNILDRCWGAGLFIFGGKGWGDITQPLSRVLMHHNKATDYLLNTNDWGGIEFWQNGPAYIYDNISGNPGGYWHWSHLTRGDRAEERSHGTARFGFAYYLDGGFKCYLFNNVAWGKTSDLTSPLCATTAFHEVIGFMNAVFNNTVCQFAAPFRRQAPLGGRGWYLGNLVMDSSEVVFRHADITAPEDANLVREGVEHYPTETLAFANNVIVGDARAFGYFDLDKVHVTLEQFRQGLAEDEALAAQTGWQVEESPVLNADAHDFRPKPDSAVTGRGVKFFVPWALSGVVGEWQFYRLPADPTRILGENWFPTEEYRNRSMYHLVPRNDLEARNVTADDYVAGPLEDWTDGALSLNGRDQYCVLPDSELSYLGRRSPSRNLDMDTNNFLIEAVLRTERGHTGGVLVSKSEVADSARFGQQLIGADGNVLVKESEVSGYTLRIDDSGAPRLELQVQNAEGCSRSASVPINDGEWHHVIAEADRAAPEGITLYVDGVAVNGEFDGTMPDTDASLSNHADFLVGADAAGNFLSGAVDYLRVARGTLADARTTIEELYEWQFNGPFLKDFFGNEPNGERDAGAMTRLED
jgi:hypothetical protein